MKDDVFVSDNWRNIIWNNRLNEIIDTDELIVFRKVSIGFSIGENQFQACEQFVSLYETQYFNKMRKDNVTMLKIK